jgi:GTP pyrophosphokinase
MADSESPGPRAEVDEILAEFAAKKALLEAFCARTKSLIEASLQDAKLSYQSVQTRVKSEKKLRGKYSDPEKDYKKLSDITDLAGLRVITYYEDDIDRVARVIEREFEIDKRNSIDKRNTEPDRFGYSAVNYVCSHLKRRTTDVEYKKFEGICCEIQVTSILRHAWSEMEHEWYDLGEAYPDKIKRRFYRIAALLELAESEFLDIKHKRTEYERSVDVRIEANVPDVTVDAVSLRSFIERDPLVAEVDLTVAAALGRTLSHQLPDEFVAGRLRALKQAGLERFEDIRASLQTYKAAVPEFVRRCSQEIWKPNNSTIVRKGVSLHHLSMLKASLEGEAFLAKFLQSAKITLSADKNSQVAIARDVVAKRNR